MVTLVEPGSGNGSIFHPKASGASALAYRSTPASRPQVKGQVALVLMPAATLTPTQPSATTDAAAAPTFHRSSNRTPNSSAAMMRLGVALRLHAGVKLRRLDAV